MRTAFLLSSGAIVAGLVIVLTMHTLFGLLLLMGGVAGVGYVAFIVGVQRIGVFLSTGTWRR